MAVTIQAVDNSTGFPIPGVSVYSLGQMVGVTADGGLLDLSDDQAAQTLTLMASDYMSQTADVPWGSGIFQIGMTGLTPSQQTLMIHVEPADAGCFATVTIQGSGTETLVLDGNGTGYTAQSYPPGNYPVTVTQTGFQTISDVLTVYDGNSSYLLGPLVALANTGDTRSL